MSKKSMTAINPQISLTIGNPEIVNMLVQQQVRALKAELKTLEAQSAENYQSLRAGVVEIIVSMDADFRTAFEKKLDAYVKARSALVGRKLNWVSPFSKEPEDGDIYKHGWICIRAHYSRGYDSRENAAWTTKEEAELSKALDIVLRLVEVPTVKDLNEWSSCWREDFGSKEEADEAWSEDNAVESGFDFQFKRSEKTIELIKKCRAIDNESIPVRARIKELNAFLADTENIEKAVLAKMTQNTLESNPELVEAFGVLTKGILGMPYLETKQLTVEAE